MRTNNKARVLMMSGSLLVLFVVLSTSQWSPADAADDWADKRFTCSRFALRDEKHHMYLVSGEVYDKNVYHENLDLSGGWPDRALWTVEAKPISSFQNGWDAGWQYDDLPEANTMVYSFFGVRHNTAALVYDNDHSSNRLYDWLYPDRGSYTMHFAVVQPSTLVGTGTYELRDWWGKSLMAGNVADSNVYNSYDTSTRRLLNTRWKLVCVDEATTADDEALVCPESSQPGFWQGTDMFPSYNDPKNKKVASAVDCREHCESIGGCKSWSWISLPDHPDYGRCTPKRGTPDDGSVTVISGDACCTSGYSSRALATLCKARDDWRSYLDGDDTCQTWQFVNAVTDTPLVGGAFEFDGQIWDPRGNNDYKTCGPHSEWVINPATSHWWGPPRWSYADVESGAPQQTYYITSFRYDNTHIYTEQKVPYDALDVRLYHGTHSSPAPPTGLPGGFARNVFFSIMQPDDEMKAVGAYHIRDFRGRFITAPGDGFGRAMYNKDNNRLNWWKLRCARKDPGSLPDKEMAVRFAPQLRFDRDTREYPISAAKYYEIMAIDNFNRNELRVVKGYNHVGPNSYRGEKDMEDIRTYYYVDRACDDGFIRIVYMWFYGYQPTCGAGGAHNGDWEMVEVFVDEQLRVKSVRYHQHGDYYTTTLVPMADVNACQAGNSNMHPVVYVGSTSHGSYHFGNKGVYSIGAGVTGGRCAQFDDQRYPNSNSYYNAWAPRNGNFDHLVDFNNPSDTEKEWIAADKSVPKGANGFGWGPNGDPEEGVKTHFVSDWANKYKAGKCQVDGELCKGASCKWQDFNNCQSTNDDSGSYMIWSAAYWDCEGGRWTQVWNKAEDFLDGTVANAQEFVQSGANDFVNFFSSSWDSFTSFLGF